MGIKGGRRKATVDDQPLVVGGDVILSAEGIAVKTIDDLTKIRERTSRLENAAPISVTVLRAGRQLKLTGENAVIEAQDGGGFVLAWRSSLRGSGPAPRPLVANSAVAVSLIRRGTRPHNICTP